MYTDEDEVEVPVPQDPSMYTDEDEVEVPLEVPPEKAGLAVLWCQIQNAQGEFRGQLLFRLRWLVLKRLGPLCFLFGAGLVAWSMQHFNMSQPALGFEDPWQVRLASFALLLTAAGLHWTFQNAGFREARWVKENRSLRGISISRAHLSIRAEQDNSTSNQVNSLAPDVKAVALSTFACAQCILNLAFYTYNISNLPLLGMGTHLQLSRHVVSWVELVVAWTALLCNLPSIFSLRAHSVLGWANAVKFVGRFSCVALLSTCAPANVIEDLCSLYQHNRRQGNSTYLLAGLVVFFAFCLHSFVGCVGLIALQVQVSQVAFVADRSPDLWSWEEFFRFMSFANNMASMQNLEALKLKLLAGAFQTNLDRATGHVAGGPGTYFSVLRRKLLMDQASHLTRLQLFVLCTTLPAEQIAQQIFSASDLKEGERVRLVVPGVLPAGSCGVLQTLYLPSHALVAWDGHKLPKRVRLYGLSEALGAFNGRYKLMPSQNFPRYSHEESGAELTPLTNDWNSSSADGWALRPPYVGRRRPRPVATCAGVFMTSPASECLGWWVEGRRTSGVRCSAVPDNTDTSGETQLTWQVRLSQLEPVVDECFAPAVQQEDATSPIILEDFSPTVVGRSHNSDKDALLETE